MIVAIAVERHPRRIRLSAGIAILRNRAAARGLVPPRIEPLIRRQCAGGIRRADDAAESILQVSRLRRTRTGGRAGQPQQRFVDVAAVNISRRRIAADAAVPLGMNRIAVVEVAGGRCAGCLADPASAVVVGVALGDCVRAGSRRGVQMVKRVPHQSQRGRPRAAGSAVACGFGDGAARTHLAQLGHVPVGIVHRSAGQGAGIAAASDFAQLMRHVVQVRGRCASLGLAPAVAVDVVAGGLGGAVVRRGDAVEVVVEVAPGLGRAADDFGLAGASSLLIQGVEVAGQHRAVEEVLFLLQPAVLKPALRGALARVQALLDQPAAGVVGEADGFAVGATTLASRPVAS